MGMNDEENHHASGKPPSTCEADQLTADEKAAAESAVGPVSRWALHRRMYDRVLGFAHSKHSTTALFLLSFAESSFFPVPPDVLLAPLCVGNRSKAMWFATVCTVASVLGGVAGYLIGWLAWEGVQTFVYDYVPGFTPEKFATVESWYDAWGIWILFAAAFTPIPFKVFTIAGGVLHQSLLLFIIVATVGRGLRFYLVAGVLYFVGPKALPLIDKYFNWLCLLFVILLVAGFAAIKLLH